VISPLPRPAEGRGASLPYLVGELENELTTAHLALQQMIDLAARSTPSAKRRTP